MMRSRWRVCITHAVLSKLRRSRGLVERVGERPQDRPRRVGVRRVPALHLPARVPPLPQCCHGKAAQLVGCRGAEFSLLFDTFACNLPISRIPLTALKMIIHMTEIS